MFFSIVLLSSLVLPLFFSPLPELFLPLPAPFLLFQVLSCLLFAFFCHNFFPFALN